MCNIINSFDKSDVDNSYKDFTIAKKNGKTRKISEPSNTLKKWQKRKLKHLYNYYELESIAMKVEDIAHGFLPNKNVVTAAEKHIGFKCTLMMDISNFFDTVTSDMIPDEISDEFYFHKNGNYCAQGFVTSPILANIASIHIIKDIKDELNNIENLEFAFTIYADDIQVSLNDESKSMINLVKSIVTEKFTNKGFSINESKTRVKYAKYGYRRILGVNVGDKEVRATRKTMRKIRAARHQSNKSSLGGLINWSNCNKPLKYFDKNDADAFSILNII